MKRISLVIAAILLASCSRTDKIVPRANWSIIHRHGNTGTDYYSAVDMPNRCYGFLSGDITVLPASR